MKRTLLVLFGVLLSAAPLAAQAAIQPNERYHHARCQAASQADDYSAEAVYCQQAAEDAGTDAELEDGYVKWADTTVEAFFLTLVGEGRAHLGNDPSGYYAQARSLLSDVSENAHMDAKLQQAVTADNHLLDLLEQQ